MYWDIDVNLQCTSAYARKDWFGICQKHCEVKPKYVIETNVSIFTSKCAYVKPIGE